MDEESRRRINVKNESEWKRNIVKKARVKGNEYVDYKNRVVPAVTTGQHCG